MIIFVVPIWIFPDSDVPSAEGDLVHLSPSSVSYADRSYENSPAVPIGNGSSVYLKFNLSRFSKINIDEINTVKLRLSFLSGSGSVRNSVFIGVTDSESRMTSDKSAALSYTVRPTLAVLHPYTTGSDDSLAELDITEYTKSVLSEKKTDIILMIYSTDSIPSLMAGLSYDDSGYRPYLKVITGMAGDTDPTSLNKSELSDCTFVSQGQPDKRGAALTSGGIITVGGGNEVYLKFKLNRAAIRDTLYSARLKLTKDSGKGKVSVCLVDNNEWSSELISYSSRPQGSQSIDTEYTVSNSDEVLIDVSQQVCNAAASSDIITLKITGAENSEINFLGSTSQYAPKLYLRTSDRSEIRCAEEAALSALGRNIPSYVMTNLSETYSDGNGKTAKLRWEEYDVSGKSLNNRHISSSGGITRPKWFEGNASVIAYAVIKCDDYTINRSYAVNIPAESAPDYSKYSFSNYIDIGNSQSEETQKFESINISAPKRHRVNGRQFSYRSPENGGIMVLNFSCVSSASNYLTLKFRCEDKASGKIFVSSFDNDGNVIELTAPEFKESQSKRFVYATYALTREFTDGRDRISLRLSFASSSDRTDEQADIYAAYMTQSPYFEPKQFSKQGEVVINEPYLGANTAKEFIDTLLTFSISGISDLITPEQNTGEPPQEQNGSEAPQKQNEKTPPYSISDNAILFDKDETNIAFSFSEEQGYADIYQRTTYYDRYSDHCPIISDGDLLMADYGSYKLIRNKSSEKTEPIPTEKFEFSGIYKDIVSGRYYSFSENWQRTDDSAVPADETVYDGSALSAEPNQIMLLSRISEPLRGSDWRVSAINGKSVSELTYSAPEKVDNVSIKAVGGVPSGIDNANVIFSVFKDGKLIKMYKSSIDVVESIPAYTIDTSDFDLYLDKTAELRIFITDKRSPANEIKPKFELP